MMQHCSGAVALMLGLCLPAHAQFPREGVAEIVNGQSAPFVGVWSIGFPEGDGIINGDPPVSCEAPVMLEAAGAPRSYLCVA